VQWRPTLEESVQTREVAQHQSERILRLAKAATDQSFSFYEQHARAGSLDAIGHVDLAIRGWWYSSTPVERHSGELWLKAVIGSGDPCLFPLAAALVNRVTMHL
jgi:hypothetical protein